jgi:hypothetical protein
MGMNRRLGGTDMDSSYPYPSRDQSRALVFPFLGASLLLASVASAQAIPDSARVRETPDTAFVAGIPIPMPTHAFGEGPTVVIDGGHNNYHTAEGRYLPFAQLLRRDGYVVQGSSARITTGVLRSADVFVVSNALHESNEGAWRPPIAQAFADDEVMALRDWVSGGGRLLLIADHSPFPEAIASLAAALDLNWVSGLARDPGAPPGPKVFRKADGSLVEHWTTAGIDSVATFDGSAFEIRRPGDELLVFAPSVADGADDQGMRPAFEGYLQGALFAFGVGRVAVFGEAAMFQARLAGPQRRPVGFNDPIAGQNPQFILNVMRWLTES